jgi:hypothetical protein
MAELDLDAIRQRHAERAYRPGQNETREDIDALLAEIDRAKAETARAYSAGEKAIAALVDQVTGLRGEIAVLRVLAPINELRAENQTLRDVIRKALADIETDDADLAYIRLRATCDAEDDGDLSVLLATVNEARCTGVSARWCPIHGDCTCPDDYTDIHYLNAEGCPLHDSASLHGDDSDG